MTTKMLIDAAHPEETRVVVVRDGKVEEFDFEAASRRQLRGNIYLAKVTRVEPSLQAAFVDYGGNRHGFLAFSEIHPDYYQIPQADRQALIDQEEAETASESDDGDQHHNGAGDSGDDGDSDSGSEGGIVEVRGGDESVESVGGDDALEEAGPRKARPRRNYKIQEVIKKRQILLVQVVKEERGNKGAALTTYLSLAGRYSVLMPNTARGGGISRKITSAPDRKKLKEIAGSLEVPTGMGVILRTAGASRTKAEIKRDFEYLLRLWENVRDLTLKSIAPTLVYEEGSLVKRAIRDLYTKDIEGVLVSGDNAYREAKDFMRMLMPSHAKNVQQYRERDPLFTKNSVEAQLDAMFSPVVTLRSGGYIVLNQTEALVSIDVNSGRSTREHNIEDTALKTNLEAADEVARQLRLRDLAGLIVIDFIDMDEKRNNRSVEKRLKDALRNDRARIQVGRISHFGLMEMSRQRIRTGVVESSMMPCPHCHGTGHVRSVESVALHVLRSIEHELLKGKATDLIVRTGQAAALYILNQKREHLREIEQRFGIVIQLEAEEQAAGSYYTLERGEPARAPVRDFVDPVSVMLEQEDEADDEVEDDEEVAEEAPAEAAAPQQAPERDEEQDDDQSGGGRRRRRRRRRGRGGEAGERSDERSDERHASQDGDDDSEEASASEDGDDRSDGDGDSEGDQQSSGRRRRRGRRGGRRHRRDDQHVEAQADAADGSGRQADERTGEQADLEPGGDVGEAVAAAAVPEEVTPQPDTAPAASETPVAAEAAEQEAEAPGESGEAAEIVPAAAEAAESAVAEEQAEAAATPEAAPAAEEAPAEKPKRRRASRAKKAEATGEASADSAETSAKETSAKETPAKETPAKKPRAPRKSRAKAEASEATDEQAAKPKRRTRKSAAKTAEPETVTSADDPAAETPSNAAAEPTPAPAQPEPEAAQPEPATASTEAESRTEAESPAEPATASEPEAPAAASHAETATIEAEKDTEAAKAPEKDSKPNRRGWWQRRGLFGGN